jgi:hypothetical protein
MRKQLLFLGMLTLALHSYGYDTRIVLNDTIPRTSQVQPATGSKASALSIGTGLGAVSFGIFSFIMMVGGSFEDAPLVYGLVGILGIAAIISGIVGVSGSNKIRQDQQTPTRRRQIGKTRNRSVWGIVLGVLGVVLSVLLTQINNGNMGW